MKTFPIDLYSDTKTRPTPGMRQAMADAEVGDEQHQEDPTISLLLDRVAQLLGHEAAVFLPSGTMANAIAVLVHCRAGDEVIAHEASHVINYEAGGASALAGAMVRAVPGAYGMFDSSSLRTAIRPGNRYDLPKSRLIVVEQTANLGGGSVWPLSQMSEVVTLAKQHGLAAHLDGARLMNASAASGVTPSQYARMFDSVYLDFTKGLGAPVGAVLAGTKNLIDQAWYWKQRLGGSMRQAGVLAAACLYALDHHVGRLTDDHENACLLATLLSDIDGIAVEPVHTNMVFVNVAGTGLTAAQFNERLAPHGIRLSAQGATRLRAVTHLDIGRGDVEACADAIRRIAKNQ